MKKRRNRSLGPTIILVIVLLVLYGILRINIMNEASEILSRQFYESTEEPQGEALPMEINYDGTYMDCPAAHCFVRMSASPQRQVSTVDTDFGEQKLIMYSCHANSKMYGLGYMKLPFDINIIGPENMEEFYNGVRSQVQNDMNIIDSVILDLDYAHFAQEFCFSQHYEEIGGTMYGKMRIIVAGEFAYYLITAKVGELSRFDEVDADTWLNSFKVSY